SSTTAGGSGASAGLPAPEDLANTFGTRIGTCSWSRTSTLSATVLPASSTTVATTRTGTSVLTAVGTLICMVDATGALIDSDRAAFGRSRFTNARKLMKKPSACVGVNPAKM